MKLFLTTLTILLSLNCYADEAKKNNYFNNNPNALELISDKELSEVTGQTGSPIELQKNIDSHTDASPEMEIRLDQNTVYNPELDRSSIFNGY